MDVRQLFSLEGRSALITGGSSGIGRMIAEGFLCAGARVYIAARRTEACDEAARALSAFGPCVPLPADVSTVEGARQLAAAYARHEKTLDILVNNAGTAWDAPYEAFPENGWDEVMALNLKAPFFLTQAFTPMLRAAAAGHLAKVIHIASIDGLSIVSPSETYSYAASKAGLIQLTRHMALRLARERIAVSAIAPGAFPSAMNQGAREHPDRFRSLIPAGRVGQPEDIAAAAIYLASNAGDYALGSTLVVDGGMLHAR